MIILFILNTLVYQKGDTLLFIAHDTIVGTDDSADIVQERVIEKWFLGESIQQIDSLEEQIIINAKVASNNMFFFTLETRYFSDKPVQTKITFYDADRNGIWEESSDSSRIISFDLSNIYDSSLIIGVDSDHNGRYPNLWTIKDKKKKVIIKEGTWERIVKYKVSPNHKYLVLHTKNPHMRKIWDYVHFVDLELEKEWRYLFPQCYSCKRSTIDVAVDDSGAVDVIAKQEHRIFSKNGKLTEFFIKYE
jgi:hypothetical protein